MFSEFKYFNLILINILVTDSMMCVTYWDTLFRMVIVPRGNNQEITTFSRQTTKFFKLINVDAIISNC